MSKKIPNDWDPVISLADDIRVLSKEVQGLLDQLAPKIKKLNQKTEEAYRIAPKKDTLFLSSPLGPMRVIWCVKCHLNKLGVQVDKIYFKYNNKSFIEHMEEGIGWLLKFSAQQKTS